MGSVQQFNIILSLSCNFLKKNLCKVHHGLKDQLLPAEDTTRNVAILQTVAHSQQAVQEEFHSPRLPNSPRGLSVWYSRSKGRQHRGYHEGALVGHFRAGCSQTSEFSNELRVSTMAFHDAPELIHLKG